MEDNKPTPIRLSDLVPPRLSFEFDGAVWEVLNVMELDLPDISKADKLGKQVQRDLSHFRQGGEDVSPEMLGQLKEALTQFTEMVVVDMPPEVMAKMKWMEQLIVLGLFQRGKGTDFLEGRLAELLPRSEQQPAKDPQAVREVIRSGQTRRRRTSGTRSH